jgi:hypothetical protein
MTQSPKPLNRLEVWVAEHSAPIFGALAVLIIIGAGLVFYTFEKSGNTQDQVNVLRPEVTTINRAICDARSLKSEKKARRCAERIRVGLVNCKRVERCRAAFLAVLTYPPPARATAPSSTELEPEGGDAVHQPSNQGHQPPGPGKGPSGGNGGNGQGNGQEAAPAPSPGASGGEGGSEADQGQESPGNGAQGSQGGESSSGVDVELCALERTCVGVEVGVDPKGLIP